jgi:DNA glycosylase AlkZ-like
MNGVSGEQIERLRAWSFERQGLARTSSDPLASLAAIAGVYGTQPSAPLSVLTRTKRLTAEAFAQMEEDRRVVRIPAMRGSLYLLPVDLAGAVNAATRAPLSLFTSRLKGVGLEMSDYEKMKPRLLEALREPVNANGIKKDLGLSEAEYMVIRLMTREGLVLRLATTPRTDRLRYVATESWLGYRLPEVVQAEATARLTDAYLRGFGPARAVDVAWWIGASKSRVNEAVAALPVEDVGGGLLLHRELRDDFEAVTPLDPGAISILPKWDAWQMGYAPDGRQRFVNDAHLPLAYTTIETTPGATAGDGLPLVLRGGRATATWSHRFVKKAIEVSVKSFPGERVKRDEVRTGFEEIAVFMSCEDLAIEIGGE